MRRLAFVLSLACAAVASALAQDRPSPAEALASGIIAGEVVTADSGMPVRGAQVRVRAANGPDTRLVVTDEHGRFEARNLFTGSWLISASKSGFTTTHFGQRRSSDELRRVNVSAGQRVEITVALQRGGAINGRVFDEFGEPLLGARIQALRSRVVRGVRQFTPVGASDSTDDTGAFRLFGLSPGSYYLSAMLRASTPDTDNIQNTIGAMTYYPGTADVSYAQPIILRSSEESTVSFQVTPVRSVRVSGTVLSANGAPAGDVEVNLRRLDNTQVGTTVGNFGRTADDGSFTIINVPPGPYVLTAMRGVPLHSRPTSATELARSFEEAIMPVTIGGEDVAGATLAMSHGVTVTGTIVAETGMTLPSPLRMEINAYPAEGLGRGAATIQITRTAGQPMTFALPGMFWSVTLGVTLPDGVMLSAIEADGVDVTDKPIELRGSAPDIRIVLTTRVTEVAGIVSNDRRPVSGRSVIVFPDNTEKWTFPSRFISLADTNERGRFTIRRLPPGERYFAAVVTSFDDGDQYDAEFLNSLRERATSFTLRDGEQKTLDLAER
jgi:5-hydroxyisourate hydrolase-like protein (transthyretin family)